MYVEESHVENRISPDQTDEFIERLVSDEEFRRALEERPAETLAEYGITVSPDLLARQVELPRPEEVEQARAVMNAGEFAPETTRLSRQFWFIVWFRKIKEKIRRRR
jgi:hypothetical protein